MTETEISEWLKIADAGHNVPEQTRDSLVTLGYLTVTEESRKSKTPWDTETEWTARSFTVTSEGRKHIKGKKEDSE